MTTQTQYAGGAAITHAEVAGWTGIVFVTLLALDLNVLIVALSAAGYNLVIPIDILGGFTYRMAPLYPAATAFILAYAMWRYARFNLEGAWLSAHCLFFVPIIVSMVMNYLTGVLLAHLSDAAVTNSQNFYFILFLKSAMSALAVLCVLAFFEPAFRGWATWLAVVIIWAGGDTLLFGLFRNELISRDVYQWLYPVERTLGFTALAFPLLGTARGVVR